MSALTYQLTVTLEGPDGPVAPYEITADQRDIAAWEVQPFGCPVAMSATRIYSFVRFLAWHASKRKGLTKHGWDRWSDSCLYVMHSDVEGDESADPGRTAPSAGI